MSEVLFVTRKNDSNPSINDKLRKSLDCDFVNADARQILYAIESDKEIKLIVLFLSKITASEELEINKYLQNSSKTPVILAGEYFQLKKYQGKIPDRVIRFIVTPTLFTNFVNEIKVALQELKVRSLEYLKVVEEDFNKIKPKHILVVDDDPVMLRTISNWLHDLFVVSVAKSGTAALQYLSKEIPDLILLDYEMPVCDGVQTLKMIRAEENLKDIPVFFLTAVDDMDLVKKALELKPQGYILKSKGSEHLISRIETFF